MAIKYIVLRIGVKLLAARSAVAGVQTVFLDVEGEYGELTGQAGGQTLSLSPAGGQTINIFDLEEEEEETTGGFSTWWTRCWK